MRIAPLLVLLVMMIPLSRAAAALSDEQRTLFFGHDQRQAIMDPTGWPWQAIGQVETASGNLCTATLISAHLALTAGHCVLTPPGKIDPAVMLRFVADHQRWCYQTSAIETLVSSFARQTTETRRGRLGGTTVGGRGRFCVDSPETRFHRVETTAALGRRPRRINPTVETSRTARHAGRLSRGSSRYALSP